MFYGIVIIMYNEADGGTIRLISMLGSRNSKCSIDFEGRVSTAARKLALLRAWIVLHREGGRLEAHERGAAISGSILR